MAIHRCLDLEGLRGNDVPAGIEQLAADHPHPPVEPALDILLHHNPVRELEEPSGHLEQILHTFHLLHPGGKGGGWLFEHQGRAQFQE